MKVEWFKVKKSSFVEGTVIATLAIVFTKILGMLYVIPFYATVGKMGGALYAYAYNIYIIFLDISTAGIPTAMSKIINEYETLEYKDAKYRAFKIGKKIIFIISLIAFLVLMIFAPIIAKWLIGDMKGGNSISDVAFTIRAVSFALLVIPFLAVSKGYLQGHKVINVSSVSQVIEQVVRIAVILVGSYVIYKVLGLPLKYAIALAVSGAFFGGLFAYLYVKFKISQSKKELDLTGNLKKDNITNKEIVKKIFRYAIPFIIISACMSIYNFVNMVFINRTLAYLDFDTKTVEYITTSITTWAPKISMIITSLAMGMTVSLIPNIVEAFTLKKWDLVNERFNKALQIIIYISLPACIGILLLAKPVWTIFYGRDTLGFQILTVCIIIPLIQNIFMITQSTLQSLNKFKAVYLSTILGLILNASLDIPLMLLFNKWGIAYVGATIATIVGYSLSIVIALTLLKKEHDLHYGETFKTTLKTLIPLVLMVGVVIGLKLVIPYIDRKVYLIGYIAIISIVGALVYLLVSIKMHLLDQVFGREYLNKILKKLTFGKFQIK